MVDDERAALVPKAAEAAVRYLEGLAERPVPAELTVPELRALVDPVLADAGEPGDAVLEQLIALGERGTVATAGPRYFGFVTGGSLPVTVAGEVLTAAWDQNAAMAVMSPLASVLEETAGRWVLDLLGLDPWCSIGFVTGGQSANTTCLAVARDHVLRQAGWDVHERGLHGGPRVTTVVGAHRHATVDVSLRTLGLGGPEAIVEADEQGRMRPEALADALEVVEGPAIVCLQAGNVVTGAFDDFAVLVALARERGAWVHVDGAFGGWAAAAPSTRHLVEHMSSADSWAVDGHKLLNVPYDSGFAVTAHPESHAATCASTASYYVQGGPDAPRDGMDWVLDASRRARGVAAYAALRSLGRHGVAELVDGLCAHARRFAELVGTEPGIEVLNEVVFDQVVLRFGDDDRQTTRTVAAIQEDGTCWAGGATWDGQAVMRVSFSSWATTDDDVERSAAAVVRCHRRARAQVR